ncbi:Secologanin synthase [Morus notabilis]|uniref:Secologanin synthase n=1 Tax=Morus notabilis TaxID=981085 RepID=W9R759_9ROSA|nr:Secologanin synthase [Morus notabilis]
MGGGGVDLLGLLLQCKDGSGDHNSMTIDDIIEECKLFYIAGQETSASLLTWTMVVLSLHPSWQEKAREEVLQLCGNKTPHFNAINHLKIVTMILNEVLRLYPPLTLLLRYTKQVTRIGEFSIPAGVEALLLVLSLHVDPKCWGGDAKEFNPQRFSKGVARSSSKEYDCNQTAFYPFGWGPRVCLGQNFAMIEVKMALAMILRHFSFELSPLYAHAPCVGLTLCPQHGAPLILHRLSS